MNLQVDPEHFFSKEYDSKERFISYWHQIYEIITLEPESILEIGIGNNFVSDYLKNRGFNVTTLDIDQHLNPDTVGSVLFMPFFDHSFEVVACFEVLEHLPYGNFPQALGEIYRVASQYVILSLPDVTRAYRLHVQLPKLGEIKRLIEFPRKKSPKHYFDGQHYWEIGKDGYPLKNVMGKMNKAGFNIKHTYRVFEFPYHRFFLLSKGEAAKYG